MTIKWIRKKNKVETDITKAVISVVWSGSTSQVSRTADIALINGPNDKTVRLLKLNIAVGDVIKLFDNNKLIFYGEVQRLEKSGESGSRSCYCVDLMDHILRSKGSYKFKNTTAEAITKKLCKEMKISVGTITATKTTIKKMICEEESLYDIMLRAYKKAARTTGKKYMFYMTGKKLGVRVKGTILKNYMLSEDANITSSSYEETSENMVNLVNIYDSKNKKVGQVKKDEWIKRYGTYRETYKKEKGVNATKAAKNLFTGIEKSVKVDAIKGNNSCISGNGVQVYDTATGLKGVFWIEGDSHTWENGIHTMSLDLNFKNLMG